MNEEVIHILSYLEKEREIPKELLIEALESALASAARKALGDKDEDLSVKMDPRSGAIKVFKGEEEIDLPDFGRIAAQTAKQVMMQKFKEAEREILFDEYTKKIGTITNGTIHRFDKGYIVVDLGKVEGILSRKSILPKEVFKIGDRVRAVIVEIKKTNKGAQVVLSRTAESFIKSLFELEVPEIYEDIVKIRAISRNAGERTKIAVHSNDDKIDCVGACVGMRGTRVKNIVKELKGEKIDIIRWSPDILEFVKSALSPAEIAELSEDKQTGKIVVVVADDQLSLAIGKGGQNVRLASKLVDRDIDIKSQSQVLASVKIPITEIDGISQKVRDVLVEAGYDNVISIAKTHVAVFLELEGIGKKTAEKIVLGAKKVLDDRGIKFSGDDGKGAGVEFSDNELDVDREMQNNEESSETLEDDSEDKKE